ncbi:histidine phosphatase family protein [Vibrio sp. LaRot3]|uniref:histidine phosphatase family protein n=1 Tax=Vibrio sp. LaRot3 TaxID=2998829 RepID=UPI0022CDCA9F|nr:histidine phosphatase family protein [Vibrio sp. LaRot3]MDA0149612.1 histidine phosphatase family protein [Vibrio sp. LaRot3]
MAHIWVMRHGRTRWNEQSRIQGHLDSPLTKAAIAELYEMNLPNLAGGTILCSDLGRATQTAELVARRSGGNIVVSSLLRERGFGVLQGEVVDEKPHLHVQWQSYHKRYQQPNLNIVGSESGRVFSQRLNASLELIARIQRGGQPLLLIVHGEWWLAFESLLNGRLFWQVRGDMAENSRLFLFPSDILMSEQSASTVGGFYKKRA